MTWLREIELVLTEASQSHCKKTGGQLWTHISGIQSQFFLIFTWKFWPSLVAQMIKNPPTMQETQVPSLGWEDPLEEGMATHSSILAWRIPWTEEPGGLQSMGSQRVGHNWATKHSTSLQKHGKVYRENSIIQNLGSVKVCKIFSNYRS